MNYSHAEHILENDPEALDTCEVSDAAYRAALCVLRLCPETIDVPQIHGGSKVERMSAYSARVQIMHAAGLEIVEMLRAARASMESAVKKAEAENKEMEAA